VGVESRDWYREEHRKSRRPRTSRWLLVALAAAALTLIAISPPVTKRLGYEPPLGIGDVFDKEPASISRQLFPGGPTIKTYEAPLYVRNDPWKKWLAPESTCPGGERTDGSRAAQTRTLLCLLNYARGREGLKSLELSGLLSRSSAAKAAAIVRCDEFAHEPCGRPMSAAARRAGYRGSLGENLYAAEGRWVAPRVAVDGWLNSPGHRENLFRPERKKVGIALLRDADFDRFDDAVIWVNEFGDS
jgi:uncharacterized protein YkwD